MTQLDTIKEKLRRDGHVDNFWCIDTRLTTRLSDKIFKLKKLGWEFRKEMDGKNCVYYATKDPEKKYPQVLPQYRTEVVNQSLWQ